MTDYLHALPPGYRIEEYELVRVLGSGGFGITYLGYDHHLDKAVAIKEYLPNDLAVRTDNNSVLPKSTQDQADYEWGLARFLNEAQTLARFDHRHIIKIHRFFRAHGTGYSVMEYAEGETLSELLQRKGTLTESELKTILFPILDGLAAVHEADFLHRDIKPGNIVIRDDGSPVLIDFGSARQAVAGKSRSVTAIVTPGYAPIEQYSAKGYQGPWTDIYGLGAVSYRCLTGEPPDDATERLREDPLVPAVTRCEGKASTSLLNAIDRALRVDEGERPQTIAEWRQLLAGDSKSGERATGSAHRPVTQSDESSTTARTGTSWFRWAPLGMSVGVIVAALGVINQSAILFIAGALLGVSACMLYQAVSKDFKKGKNAYSVEEHLEAIRWYRKVAEQGHAKAQYELSLMYARGEGVTKDYTEAARWCRKAAEQGNAEAQLRLGTMYTNGKGVVQDDAEAARWVHEAAAQGNAEAQYRLGGMYCNGKGVAWDDAEAAKWFRKAAKQGHGAAQLSLGLMYQFGVGVVPNPLRYPLRFFLWFIGMNVAQDYAKAARWYRKAAKQGDAMAQSNLGAMYTEGYGVAQDYAEAAQWYRKAAEQGNAEAQYRLGLAYASGLGVAKDDVQAATWYQKAAERGHGEAQLKLGTMYHVGTGGIAQNYVLACMWLNIATSTAAPDDYWREEAREKRTIVEAEMTAADISEAQRRARICLESNTDIWEAQRRARIHLANYQ